MVAIKVNRIVAICKAASFLRRAFVSGEDVHIDKFTAIFALSKGVGTSGNQCQGSFVIGTHFARNGTVVLSGEVLCRRLIE